VALATQTTGNYVADITAGNAITTSGGGSENATVTVNHADTSSQASVNNSGNTFIQDITLDTYGHVTAITSAASTITLPASYHAIGDYILGYVFSNVSVNAGSTISGNYIAAAKFQASGNINTNGGLLNVGTWRNNAKTSLVQYETGIVVRTA
jgi:hypothetical protein